MERVVMVSGDKAACWRYGHRIALPVALLLIPLTGLAMLAGAVPNDLTEALRYWLICASVGALWGYGRAMVWRATIATTRYVVTTEHLEVWSRGRLVSAIPRREISSFDIQGRMNGWAAMTRGFDAVWPRGVVGRRIEDGGPSEVRLPPIAVWGENAGTGAATLRAALSLSGR